MSTEPRRCTCQCCVLGQEGPNAAISEGQRSQFVREIAIEQGGALKLTARSHKLLVIREGVGKTEHWLDDGRTAVTGFHYPGETMEIPGHEGKDSVFEAVTGCRICEIDIRQAERVLPDAVGFHETVVDHAMKRISDDRDRMIRLAHMNAADRVIGFLDDLTRRAGATNGDPSVVWMPMRRDDIANYLGMQPETLSRTYSQLVKQGAITVRGRQQVRLMREQATI